MVFTRPKESIVQTEKLLAMVDQSPNSVMQEALDQTAKALIDERLLKHSNVDIQVSVASCLSELTRIAAPDAPFSDDKMKGVLELIVSSFEGLSDESSQSYGKRVSILETVSKVRLCAVMLDLECDYLMQEMFEQFFKSVRDHHLNTVYSPMVDIMSLVLEESEEISADMIKLLLGSLKNNSDVVLPVARKLGEDVLKKSGEKLKPYLKKIMTILGDFLENYSQVLTSVCEGTQYVVEHNDESASVQPQADESSHAPLSDNTAKVISKGKPVSGNGGSDDKQSNKEQEADDLVIRSSKRARKRTLKVEENLASKHLEKESNAKKNKVSSKKSNAGKPGSKKLKQAAKKVGSGDFKVKPSEHDVKKDTESDSVGKPLKQTSKKGVKSKVIARPAEDVPNIDEGSGLIDTPLMVSASDDEITDDENIPLALFVKKGNKSSSSVVKSSKKKDGRKLGCGKHLNEKDQAQSVSEDDGMNVSLKLVLETATKGEDRLEKAPPTFTKRNRSVRKFKVNIPKSHIQNEEKADDFKGRLENPLPTFTKQKRSLRKSKVNTPNSAVQDEDKPAEVEGQLEKVLSNLSKGKRPVRNTKLKIPSSVVQNKDNPAEVEVDLEKVLTTFSKRKRSVPNSRINVSTSLVQNEEKAAEAEIKNTDVAPEIHLKKKSRIDSGSSASQAISEDSAKRAGEVSMSGKSKGPASKSAAKSEGKGKVDTQSKPVKSKKEDLEISEINTNKQ